jgi:two-component system C4-dicarboxylate transport response regulator DctD
MGGGMTSGRVIFVDDERAMRSAVEQWLGLAGFDISCHESAEPALDRVRRGMADVLVTDVKMPGVDGMELLTRAKRAGPDVPIILLTAHGDIAMAVEAMRNGAYDFLEKPFHPDHLVEVIRKAMDRVRLLNEVQRLRDRMGVTSSLEDRLIGISEPMRRTRAALAEIANIDADVIIHGETGTGKEVAARALHDFSPRASAPFVAINCAAVPMDLAESELFGHVSGAFTGAKGVRVGKFEHATGGTLFLDEIESMPLALQAKVLRAVQERTIERVGANQSIPINIRIVAATKTDLAAASNSGTFRADLFYRLNKVEIRLPPLRYRKEDIPLLFDAFIGEAAARYKLSPRSATPDDMARLMTHCWPGNVRELKTVAERFAMGLASTGRSVAMILDGVETVRNEEASLAERVAAYERSLIAAALAEHRGNIAGALEALKIPRRTLNEKMTRFNLDRSQFLDTAE